MNEMIDNQNQTTGYPSARDEMCLHLVLGAGGVKSLSYIGAIKALTEHGYSFASVSAASGGTLIAALLAAGLTSEEMERAIHDVDFTDLAREKVWFFERFGNWPFAKFRASGVGEIFRKILGGDPQFKHLKIPFATMALDINSKELLVYSTESHKEMRVSEALSIATSVPMLMPPHQREGRLLIDGAIVSGCPAWLAEAHRNHPDVPVLALSAPKPPSDELPSSIGVYLEQLFEAVSESHDQTLMLQLAPNTRLRKIELFSTLRHDKFDLSEVEKDNLINNGYKVLKEALAYELWPKRSAEVNRAEMLAQQTAPVSSAQEDDKAANKYARLISSLATRPIKILFIAANPTGTTRLQIDDEMRIVDEELYNSKYRDRFDLRQYGAVRVSDLQKLLLRHEPDIVHFSGHGSPESEIILQDEQGEARTVSNHVLSDLFQELKDNIRCVILNACYSESQAQAIADHIDCVIGMSTAITDRAAILFSTGFYRALGFGKDVQTAYDLGCQEIALQDAATATSEAQSNSDNRNLIPLSSADGTLLKPTNTGQQGIIKIKSKIDPSTIVFVKRA